ncbi:hypothetical protein BGX29_004392, partial [Mortierella sp. GBA35]
QSASAPVPSTPEKGMLLSRSQKKKIKKRNKAEMRAAADAGAHPEDLIQIKTRSDAICTINCHFEAGGDGARNYVEDRMGKTLVEFCRHYAFNQGAWMRGGVVPASMRGGQGQGKGKGQSSVKARGKGKTKGKKQGKRRSGDDYDDYDDYDDDSDWGSDYEDDSDSEGDSDIDPFDRPRIEITDQGWGSLVFEKCFLALTGAEDESKIDTDDELDDIWGVEGLELDGYGDATALGKPAKLAQLMIDVHSSFHETVGR